MRWELALLVEITGQRLWRELTGRYIRLLLNTHCNLLQDFRRYVRTTTHGCVSLLADGFTRDNSEVSSTGYFLSAEANGALT